MCTAGSPTTRLSQALQNYPSTGCMLPHRTLKRPTNHPSFQPHTAKALSATWQQYIGVLPDCYCSPLLVRVLTNSQCILLSRHCCCPQDQYGCIHVPFPNSPSRVTGIMAQKGEDMDTASVGGISTFQNVLKED